MNAIFKSLLILILFSISIFSTDVLGQVIYSDITKNISIGDKIYTLEDKNSNFTIEEVSKSDKFIKSTKDVPNFGHTPSSMWLRITVKNLTNVENLILQLNQPIVDFVEFYSFNPKTEKFEVISMGEYKPFRNRKYKTPEYLFDLIIAQNKEQTYYMKVSCKENLQIPIILGNAVTLYQITGPKNIASGIYIGIMLVMLLYNLFIFGIVRDKSYLYYTLYIVIVLITQTSLQGLPFQFLWPNNTFLAIYSPFIFPSLSGIFGLEFFKEFLQLKTRNFIVYKYSFLFLIPYFVSIILGFSGQYNESFEIMEITASAVSMFMLIVAVIVYRQGNQEARFFLVGWTLFLVGICIYVLKDFELLPYNNFTRYTMHFGSGIEVILLSFALADRINILKKDKELSQAQVLEALRLNEKLVTEQNIVLEQKVQARTVELEDKNVELGVTLKHLKETQSQLVVVEKMASLGQLTAGIAHEINNPINFVSANIKPLQMDIADIFEVLHQYENISFDDTSLKDKFAKIDYFKKEIDLNYIKTEINALLMGIEDGAKRTAEIVKGLRNFSHLDESDIKLADINKGLESTLILLRSSIPKTIEVVLNLGEIPMIECYPGKLNQAFMNILNNAIHAMEKDPIAKNHTLTISTNIINEKLVVEVEDTGIGMKKEVVEKIFEPFFTTKDVGDGTGLGMSIVFGIIESHNGKIEIESTPGLGSKIVLTLPTKLTKVNNKNLINV